MSPVTAWIASAGIVGLAGLVRGFSGFGGALVMSPGLSLLYGPAGAVASISLIDLPAVIYLLPEAVRHGEWRSILPMGLAGVTAVPAGAWLLVHLDPSVTSRVIGLVVLTFATALLAGWRYRRRRGMPLTASVGAASGLLGGAIGIPGPPIILFFLSGPTAARVSRASIAGFFMFTTCATLITYFFYALYTPAVVLRAGTLLPVYFLGVWSGSRWFRVTSEATFRRVALVVLLAIGLAALVA